MTTEQLKELGMDSIVTLETATKADFGNGRYSKVAEELYYNSLHLLKISKDQAEKLAKSYVSDLGRLNSVADKVTIGKVNKDGYVSLKESAKVTKTKMTVSMRVAKVVIALQDAVTLGVAEFGEIKLDEDLSDWLA